MRQRPNASRSTASRARGGILLSTRETIRRAGSSLGSPAQGQWHTRASSVEAILIIIWYKEKLSKLRLFSLERRQKADLTVICYSLMGNYRHSGKAERQQAQARHEKFWQDARKTFTVSMVTHWNRRRHHFSGLISGDRQPALTLNLALLSAQGWQSSLRTSLPAKLPQKRPQTVGKCIENMCLSVFRSVKWGWQDFLIQDFVV